jgi:protoheme IX farnesyltransferase
MPDLQETGAASWRDYKELTKPNVVMLMILTSAIGMFMAVPGMVPLDILVLGIWHRAVRWRCGGGQPPG